MFGEKMVEIQSVSRAGGRKNRDFRTDFVDFNGFSRISRAKHLLHANNCVELKTIKKIYVW